jgi:hypothetical protein
LDTHIIVGIGSKSKRHAHHGGHRIVWDAKFTFGWDCPGFGRASDDAPVDSSRIQTNRRAFRDRDVIVDQGDELGRLLDLAFAEPRRVGSLGSNGTHEQITKCS